MKCLILTVAAAALLVSGRAEAGSFLKALARQGASSAVHAGLDRSRDEAADEPGATAQAPPAPAAAPAAGARRLRYTTDIAVSDDDKRAKKAFETFSAYPCSDCEGGRGFDAWVRLSANLTGNNAWEDKVGALTIGQTFGWKGRQADGVLAVSSEDPVGGIRCKQVRYTLTRRADHQQAERPGLFCYGRLDAYAGADRWIEVF